MGLDPLQQAFVHSYLKHGNSLRAAKEAGYQCTNSASFAARGSQLLRNISIRAEIDKQMELREDAYKTDQKRIIEELLKIAFVDVRMLGAFDSVNGFVYESSDDLPDDLVASIAEITDEKLTTYNQKGEEKELRKLKVKLYDKMKALEMLCRHLGMFKADEVGSTEVLLEAALKKLGEGGKSVDEMVAHLRTNKPSVPA